MNEVITKIYPDINEQKTIISFANGLKVHFVPKSGYKEMYCGLCVNFGSFVKEFYSDKKYQVPQGVAHFIEHMLFSLENDEKSVSAKFDNIGLECNAFTDFLKTVFYFSGINDFNTLKKGFTMLLEFIFNHNFSEKRINNEKKIIIQEKRMYENDPSIILGLKILSLLYIENNTFTYPIFEDTLGEIEDINKINKEILELCYNTFYVPNNINIVIVGDFNKEEIITMLTESIINKLKYKNLPKICFSHKNTLAEEESTFDINVTKVAIGVNMGIKMNHIQNVLLSTLIYKLFYSIIFASYNKYYQKMIKDELFEGKLNKDLYVDKNTSYFVVYCDSKRYLNCIKMLKKQILNRKNINNHNLSLYKKKAISYFISTINNVENLFFEIIDYINFNEDVLESINLINKITLDDLKKIKITKKDIKTYVIKPIN